jgi:gentisate 1,2-dioxygenase
LTKNVNMSELSIQELLATQNCQPLWDRYRNLVSREPLTKDSAMHWSWQAMQALIAASIIATRLEEAERRVLLLTHPAFSGETVTTTNILGGLQILQPGEFAPPHRHTLGALRFVLQGSGATTYVDGLPCAMSEGDFIITPSWSWHEHENKGTNRVVWFDCLDLPLARHLGSVFFEPGQGENTKQPSERDHNPVRFDWASSLAKLLASSPNDDGSRQYLYPQTLMPALNCQLVQINQGVQTVSMRSTSNAVIVIVQGQGVSTVGDRVIEWQKNDVLSLPHWQWTTHRASADAIFFKVSDEPLLRMLGYFRQELT